MDWISILVDAVRASLGPEAALYALAAIGLNMQFGYAGLLNFGQVAFMLVGAYSVAVIVSVASGPLWAGVLVALLAAVVLALVLGFPTLRLRADYLAITTVAAAEILRYVARSGAAEPLTGGVFGITGFSTSFYAANPFPDGEYGLGRLVFDERSLWLMCSTWTLVLLGTLLVFLLMRSPWGRVVRAIREDEDAVRSVGKNVFAYRMQCLVLGGVFGGMAGMMLGVGRQAVNPDLFIPQVTFFCYAILLLGGAARILSPIAGTMIFWFVVAGFDSVLRQAVSAGVLSGGVFDGQTIGALRYVLVGFGLMFLMIYRPQGVFGDRRELMLDAR